MTSTLDKLKKKYNYYTKSVKTSDISPSNIESTLKKYTTHIDSTSKKYSPSNIKSSLKKYSPFNIKSSFTNFKKTKIKSGVKNVKSGIIDKLTWFLDTRLIAFIYALLSAIYFYKVIVNRNVNCNKKEDMDSFYNSQKIFYIYIFTTLGVLIILNIIKRFINTPQVLLIIVIIACILCITPIATLLGLIIKSNLNKKTDYS